MKQITPSFVSGRIEEFPELQDAHRKVKAEYENLHANMKSLDRRQIDSLPGGEYTVERKWDGIFVGCINTQWHTNFITPSGNVYGMPLYSGYENLQCGELYCTGQQRRERVHTVLHALALGCHESVMFYPFSSHRRLPSTPKSNIERVFDQYLATGAEGVVIRQVNGSGIWKLKPKMNIDCVVIGYTEETVGEVKSLIVGIPRNYFAIQPLGAVGSNISSMDRKHIWDSLQGGLIETIAPMVHDGQAVQAVLPRICVEISCNDIVTEKSDGKPIMKSCYDMENMSVVGVAPFCTLRGAYFERLRRDKLPSQILVKQITDYVHIDDIDVDCRTLKGAEPQIVEEARFVKGDAVKRLVAIQRSNDPEYVVHLTDYSPNRATPTKYEIMVTNDLDQLSELLNSKAREIQDTRGWSRA